MTEWDHPAVGEWEALGAMHRAAGHDVFAVDLPASGREQYEPLVVIHGYPTSSFDFTGVVSSLALDRRVVLVDLVGFGFSAKPDIRYTMTLQADVIMAIAAELALDRFALLTHDMGDTVGGELLARQLEGSWPVEITRRVVTNGSIYIQMANLTAGQKMLLFLPDRPIDPDAAPGQDALARSLVATLSPSHSDVDMSAHAEVVRARNGNQLLARTIRYIEERRANERRFTGAIESHPSPVSIVWGPEDPIAVAAMAERLQRARPDAQLSWVAGAGHYPQLEEPGAYLEAVLQGLR